MRYTKEQINQLRLDSGDVLATRGNFPLGTLARLIFTPDTDRYHFGLVISAEEANRLCKFLHMPPITGQWAAVEATAGGIGINELTSYAGVDIKFYRVNCPADIRHRAPVELAGFSRAGYDYKLFFRLLARVIAIEWVSFTTTKTLRKLRAAEMPLDEDSEFVCTEGVDEGYDQAGYHLIEVTTLGIPSAYREAELAGRMTELNL